MRRRLLFSLVFGAVVTGAAIHAVGQTYLSSAPADLRKKSHERAQAAKAIVDELARPAAANSRAAVTLFLTQRQAIRRWMEAEIDDAGNPADQTAVLERHIKQIQERSDVVAKQPDLPRFCQDVMKYAQADAGYRLRKLKGQDATDDLAKARASGAASVLRALIERERIGEPITPFWIVTRFDAMRQLADAEMAAADTDALRLAAAERHLDSAREYLKDQEGVRDGSPGLLAIARYVVSDATYLVEKTKPAGDARRAANECAQAAQAVVDSALKGAVEKESAPHFHLTQWALRRRVDAELQAAADNKTRISAAERYVMETRKILEAVKARFGPTSTAAITSEFDRIDAEYLLLKLQASQ